jgi:hypothetical protein
VTIAAVLAAVVALFLVWKKKMPKVTTWLALLAGAGLTVGWVGHGSAAVVNWAADLVSTGTRSAVGEAVPWVLAVPVLLNVVHDLWPKNAANRTTMVCAFFLPVLAALIPGPVGDGVQAAIAALTGTSADAVNATIGK